MLYIYILIIAQLLNGLFLWKGYQKAGYAAWQAFVPFYNTVMVAFLAIYACDRQYYVCSNDL